MKSITISHTELSIIKSALEEHASKLEQSSDDSIKAEAKKYQDLFDKLEKFDESSSETSWNLTEF